MKNEEKKMPSQAEGKGKMKHGLDCFKDRMIVGFCAHDKKTGERVNPLEVMEYQLTDSILHPSK